MSRHEQRKHKWAFDPLTHVTLEQWNSEDHVFAQSVFSREEEGSAGGSHPLCESSRPTWPTTDASFSGHGKTSTPDVTLIASLSNTGTLADSPAAPPAGIMTERKVQIPLNTATNAAKILETEGLDRAETTLKRPDAETSGPTTEKNWSVSIQLAANDPYYLDGALWGMLGDRTSIVNPFGSQAGEIWASQQGSANVVVGVVDTGIDFTHPDLYLNIWINQGEIPTATRWVDVDADGQITFQDLNNAINRGFLLDRNGNGYIDAGDLLQDPLWANGVDTDGNGFVDDIIGWDFANNDNNPYDGNGHGTHVAGTIAATGANGQGVIGVAPGVQVMALKFLGDNGSGTTAGAVSALDYYTAASKAAATRTPNVNYVATNNSWGGGGYSTTLLNAIVAGAQQDILFVGAAGNGSANTDLFANYPSNYSTLNSNGVGYEAVISVAALQNNGALASYSNYGATSVDLGAPGSSILSTTPNQTYSYYSGTSMATPHVAGAIALYASANPGLSAAQIRAQLLSTTALTGSLAGLTATGGRLDVSAMFGEPTPPPPPISSDDYPFSTATSGTVAVGGSATSGNIELSNDRDAFAITLAANTTYAFSLVGLSGFDPVLELYDGSLQTRLSFNDDANGTLNAEIIFTALQAGTYFLVASGFGTATGSYQLTATLRDSIRGTATAEILDGTAGNDRIYGEGGNDTLNGLAGNDLLDGGTGSDRMLGGSGNDAYYVDNVGDLVYETTTPTSSTDAGGVDEVFASVTFSLDSAAGVRFVENLTLTGVSNINATGNGRANVLTGNSGNNTLNGLGGNDILNGGAGNDVLIGGAGVDDLTGFAGSDIFDFNNLTETGNSTATRDVIRDFTPGSDKIDLSTIDASSVLRGNDAFVWISDSQTSGVFGRSNSGELQYVWEGGNTIIYADTDADSAPEFQIALIGKLSLTAADFIL